MATISREINLDMLRKNKDGTYTKYNPKTKANLVQANVNGVAGSDVQTILQNLFQFANNGKKAVANSITAMGVPTSPTDTFSILANKIGQINTGKKWATGTNSTQKYTFPLITTGKSHSEDNYRADSTNLTVNTVIVTGLAFNPSIIIIYGISGGNFYRHAICFNNKLRNVISVYTSNYNTYALSDEMTTAEFQVNSYFNKGFVVPTVPWGPGTYSWVAIE